jgi:type VI secretion system secreted protein VgrG
MAEVPYAALKPAQYFLELRAGQFEARELRGSEHLSTPYRFEIVMRDADELGVLDPDAFLGDIAFITLFRGNDKVRRLRGIVTHMSLEAVAHGVPELTVVVEPRLVRTLHRSSSRVFRNMTVPEIVTQVLNHAGVAHEMRLSGEYPKREHTTQFRETDFNFVSRLLEDEGIFYFFQDDFEGGFSGDEPVLKIGDHQDAYSRRDEDLVIPFRPAKALNRPGECIQEIGLRAQLTPSEVTLRDFNPDTPSLDMEVRAAGPTEAGVEYYDYPGKYATVPEGQRKAQLMSEALRCAAMALHGQADCTRFGAGYVYSLVEGPDGAPDGEYVLTSVEHRWEREQPYSNQFETMDAAIVYRPARLSPPPRVVAPLTGFVSGPEGEDIYTDAMGRVKVHFPWDQQQVPDEDCSLWVPVLQDNTGQSASIPRVGWEVLVSFLEGDPDRPTVLGRVYNAADPFPEMLPAGKTRSTLKAITSPPSSAALQAPKLGIGLGPGIGGETVKANEIYLDDATGSELIYIQAQKDQSIVVANDKTENVLNKEANVIVGDETVVIGGNNTVVVGNDRQLTIEGNQKLTVGGSRSREVGVDDTEDVKGNRTVKIGGIHFRRIATNDNLACNSLKEMVGGLNLEASLKGNSTNAGQASSLIVGGALVELAAKDKTESVDGLRAELVGGLLLTNATTTFDLRADKARNTTVGAAMSTTSVGPMLLKAGTALDASAAGMATYKGATSVTLKVGAHVVKLEGGLVSIDTPADIVLEAGGMTFFGAGEAQFKP